MEVSNRHQHHQPWPARDHTSYSYLIFVVPAQLRIAKCLRQYGSIGFSVGPGMFTLKLSARKESQVTCFFFPSLDGFSGPCGGHRSLYGSS